MMESRRKLCRACLGLSLIEIMIALVFLTLAVVSMFSFFSFSNRGFGDAYRETIARSLAQEGLEWVSGLGYEKLLALQTAPQNPLADRLGLETFVRVGKVVLDDGSFIQYPEEYRQFERKIQIIHFPGDRVFLIRVTVQPAENAIRRGNIILEKLVGAEYD